MLFNEYFIRNSCTKSLQIEACFISEFNRSKHKMINITLESLAIGTIAWYRIRVHVCTGSALTWPPTCQRSGWHQEMINCIWSCLQTLWDEQNLKDSYHRIYRAVSNQPRHVAGFIGLTRKKPFSAMEGKGAYGKEKKTHAGEYA